MTRKSGKGFGVILGCVGQRKLQLVGLFFRLTTAEDTRAQHHQSRDFKSPLGADRIRYRAGTGGGLMGGLG